MLDDHKYSLKRKVAYAHPNPGMPVELYGPGGPERTYGEIIEVHLVESDEPRWEYSVTNSFTSEECRVQEDEIFHGANLEYLDLKRRDGIHWVEHPPTSAKTDPGNDFWKKTVRSFLRTAVPKIREAELDQERERSEGRKLPLDAGDYIKVRGDLRQEMEPSHNLYAKILTVSPADREYLEVAPGTHGLPPGDHRILHSYQVILDNGEEADVYDVEVKAVYTTNGRSVILNWRAATFLAEAFGDHPPYEVHMEFLNGHVFNRLELEGMTGPDMAEILVRLLYAKGLILWEEIPEKTEKLTHAPVEFLVDHILATSRFDMLQNRSLAGEEIDQRRAEDSRLRKLFE